MAEDPRCPSNKALFVPHTAGSIPNFGFLILALPKAELHLHLEGSILPGTAVVLAARHGLTISETDVAERYAPGDFAKFLEAFKWVTSFLRTPADYALVTESLGNQLLSQNVVYAEVTLSLGVMLRRSQDPLLNFTAIKKAASQFESKGLWIHWIFDAVRQFGVPAAQVVADLAAQCKHEGVVAFGLGGDELALPAQEFRGVYDFAASNGLQKLIHAGELGDARAVREAVEDLGVARIGHAIGAMHDPRVMDFLAARGVALEVCPTSNLRTGALAMQLGLPSARIDQHPLPSFLDRGLQVTLSTDDPAMFETSLSDEYRLAAKMGISDESTIHLLEMSFQNAFLPQADRDRYLQSIRSAQTAHKSNQ
jgi:aminodeoxyfutalosine deaminase